MDDVSRKEMANLKNQVRALTGALAEPQDGMASLKQSHLKEEVQRDTKIDKKIAAQVKVHLEPLLEGLQNKINAMLQDFYDQLIKVLDNIQIENDKPSEAVCGQDSQSASGGQHANGKGDGLFDFDLKAEHQVDVALTSAIDDLSGLEFTTHSKEFSRPEENFPYLPKTVKNLLSLSTQTSEIPLGETQNRISSSVDKIKERIVKDSLTTPTETMKNNSAAEIAQKSSDSVTEIAESLPNSPIETVKKVSHTSTKSQNYTTDDPKKEPPFSQTPFLKASVLSPQSPAFTPSRNKAIEGDDLLLSISSGSLQSSIHATRGKQSEITSHTKLYSPAPSYPNVSHNNSGFKNPHSLTNSSAEVSSQSTRNSLSFGYKNTKGAQVDRPRNELISYDVDTPAISEEHSVLMSSFQEPTKTPLASTRLEKQPLITLKPLEPLESSKIMKVSKKSRWISDCLVTPPKTQLQTHDTSENLKPPKTPRHMIPYDPQPESPELFNKMYAIAQIMQDKSEKERKDKVAQEKKKRDEDEAQRKHKEADVQRKAKEAETKENGDWETVTENNDPGYPSTKFRADYQPPKPSFTKLLGSQLDNDDYATVVPRRPEDEQTESTNSKAQKPFHLKVPAIWGREGHLWEENGFLWTKSVGNDKREFWTLHPQTQFGPLESSSDH